MSTTILSKTHLTEEGPVRVQLSDKHIETDGAVRAQLQDNTNEIVSIRICQKIANVTLASNAAIDSNTITLVPGHGTVAGNVMCLKQSKRYYQAVVTNVATDVITLDSPLDFEFNPGAIAFRSSAEMNVNGSVTPQVFAVSPPSGTAWHVYGMDLAITDNTAMDDSTFGGTTALANGLVFRQKDGTYKNFFNVKNNGEFHLWASFMEYSAKAPAGSYGLNVELSFPEHNGCAVYLGEGDEMQLIIQDDLTGLSSFRATVSGHVVV